MCNYTIDFSYADEISVSVKKIIKSVNLDSKAKTPPKLRED